MKEQFVPYSIALELKEKGFDNQCLGFYTNNNEHYIDGTFFLHLSHPFTECELEPIKSGTDHCILAPLWQQVFDWFRDKHQLEIDIFSVISYQNESGFILNALIKDLSKYKEDKVINLIELEEPDYKKIRQKAIEQALTLI